MTDTDLAWLAGLLEGEGFFGTAKNRHGTKRPVIECKMTDRDVIARAAALFGNVSICNKPGEKPGYRAQYRIRLEGERAKTMMQLLLPLMGERRRYSIVFALGC